MKHRRTPGRFLTAGLFCLAAACASVQAQPPKSDSAEVAALKRRVVELQRRATVGEVEVARLRQEIARLEQELQAARRGMAADPSSRAATRPVIEDVATGPIVVADGIEESELEEEVIADSNAGREAGQTAGEGGPPPVADSPRSAQPPEALSVYDDGYTLFHQKRYGEAEERFRRYLALYPDSELADNAQFWIGECHYARNDYAAALDAFSATVERYPQGNKVADALLKAGKSLEALGHVDQARQTYHEVTDRFPSSAAAVIARERLAVLP